MAAGCFCSPELFTITLRRKNVRCGPPHCFCSNKCQNLIHVSASGNNKSVSQQIISKTLQVAVCSFTAGEGVKQQKERVPLSAERVWTCRSSDSLTVSSFMFARGSVNTLVPAAALTFLLTPSPCGAALRAETNTPSGFFWIWFSEEMSRLAN